MNTSGSRVCKTCVRAKFQSRRDAGLDKENSLNCHFRRKFGITLTMFKEMVAAQGGLCAICKRPPKAHRRLSVDHDHRTGKVRALLCLTCNVMIGQAADSPALLESGIAYLRAHGQ